MDVFYHMLSAPADGVVANQFSNHCSLREATDHAESLLRRQAMLLPGWEGRVQPLLAVLALIPTQTPDLLRGATILHLQRIPYRATYIHGLPQEGSWRKSVTQYYGQSGRLLILCWSHLLLFAWPNVPNLPA